MVGTAYMRMQIDRKEPDEFGFDDDDPVAPNDLRGRSHG